MEIGVRRLHNSYRVAGSTDESGLVRARLDRIAAADLPREFETALAAALRDDPTVYVVRRVQPTTWLADTTAGDARVARRWGQSMARAVLAVLAAGRPEDVACFADETAYVDRLHTHEQDLEDALHLFEIGRRQWARVLRRLPDEVFLREGTHNRRGRVTLGDMVAD